MVNLLSGLFGLIYSPFGVFKASRRPFGVRQALNTPRRLTAAAASLRVASFCASACIRRGAAAFAAASGVRRRVLTADIHAPRICSTFSGFSMRDGVFFRRRSSRLRGLKRGACFGAFASARFGVVLRVSSILMYSFQGSTWNRHARPLCPSAFYGFGKLRRF